MTELETKYNTALEIQHRVDFTKLKKTVTELDGIIWMFRNYVLKGQKQADLLFQRIFGAVNLYRNVAITDTKAIGKIVNKYQESYENSSQTNDKIVLEILSELEKDVDYLIKFVEVQSERISSPSTKFILNRTALNIDMYFNMKDVPDDASASEEYNASKPYPQEDKLDSSCPDKLANTSSMEHFLKWLSRSRNATEIYAPNQNSSENNTTNEDANHLDHLHEILSKMKGSLVDAIHCRSFRGLQLRKASVIITSLFEKQSDFGEYSDTVVFDFEREFQPITEQMVNFEGEFCLVQRAHQSGLV